jgi:predicted nucleic acid-binding protein
VIFVDTNVVVAAVTPSDPRHEACLDVLAAADRRGGCCAAHSLAEIFSVLSGRPGQVRLPPLDAAQVANQVKTRYSVVSLTPPEYLAAIQLAAERGQSGGIVYDALLMACARKAKASRIYTLNARHFRLVAPDLASKITEP